MVEDVFNIGFLQLKWPPVGHLWSHHIPKIMCLCKTSCVVFLPSTNKIVRYMSEIWWRTHTHACTDMKIDPNPEAPISDIVQQGRITLDGLTQPVILLRSATWVPTCSEKGAIEVSYIKVVTHPGLCTPANETTPAVLCTWWCEEYRLSIHCILYFSDICATFKLFAELHFFVPGFPHRWPI